MSKGMFDRLFKFLVKKCNETLDTQQKRQHFIGVLDIAGFEIFDVSIPALELNYNDAIPTTVILQFVIQCIQNLHVTIIHIMKRNYLALICYYYILLNLRIGRVYSYFPLNTPFLLK